MTGLDQRNRLRGIFAAVLAAVLLSSCSVIPDYFAPRFDFSSKFSAGPKSVPVRLENTAWWRSFNDPALDALIETALQGNLDLEIARERIIEARALAATVSSGASITGSASALHRGGSDTETENGITASLGLGWLFDPYGGREAQRQAAAARIEVTDAERDAAQLLLLSNLANAYIDLCFARTALALRNKELRSRRQTLRLVRELVNSEVATRLDEVRAEALIAETQTQLPTLEAAIRSRTHEIAVLLGRAPGSDIGLAGSGRQPQPSMSVEIGIPTDLVRNRPDIRIAERLYYAATADIGAARADLYPALSLGGTIELSAFGGDESNSFQLGPTVRLPALPNGSRQAEVAVRESRARQAHTVWSSTVLGAIRDVESALAEYSGSAATVQASRRTVRLYSETVRLTREVIASEGATIRDLLDAEQSVAVAQISLANALRQLGRTFVTLNVSLGSGNQYSAAYEFAGQ